MNTFIVYLLLVWWLHEALSKPIAYVSLRADLKPVDVGFGVGGLAVRV